MNRPAQRTTRTEHTEDTQDMDTTTHSSAHGHGPGCADFHTSRRGFLKGVSAVAGGVVLDSMTGGVFRQVAYAASGTARNVLVVLSLRGGADGLSMVVPHGEPAYEAARGRIAIPRDALIARDSMFGLHPKFEPLKQMWNDGRFGAVHAVGLPQPNRSHFAAMEEMEDADLGSNQRRGWLNRMIGLDTSSNPLEAVHMGSPLVPTSLYGPSPVVATHMLSKLKLHGTGKADARQRKTRSLNRVWGRGNGDLGRAARSAMRTVNRVEDLATSRPTPPRNDARYPVGDLGKTLADTARLLRADLGVETVTLDYSGWDMHTNLGDVRSGAMTDMVEEMAKGLAAFFKDLGALGNRVTVVTISEFGRRVEANGNNGLDHGFGNVMLLLGAGVKGGRVHGNWPGIGPGDLREGDLQVTRDYRSVLTEVLRSRFPQVNTSKVFPHFKPETINAMRLP
jgi:uncharacterized protein (DUF1501 family)